MTLVCVAAASCAPSPGPSRAAPPEHAHVAVAAAPPVGCRAGNTPIGALPPATPAWCGELGPAVDTAMRKPNGWVDEFDSGAGPAALSDSYRLYGSPRRQPTTVYRTETFAHGDHWMVDIGGHGAPPGVYEGSALDFELGPNNGGALMRPVDGFRFVNGKLVVELDVSAGMTAYGDRVWPEVVVSTAADPSTHETNGWYAAGLFGGHPAVGCSLPSDRLAECRVYDDARITANMSASLRAGAKTVFGGAPTTPALDAAWRTCADTDPDAKCRDRFRIEFEKDAITLFVNGVKYMEHRGLPPSAQLPDALLTSTVYVYFASWAYLVDQAVARVHWGRIAVNP